VSAPEPRASASGSPSRIKFAVVREDPDVEHALCLHNKAERLLVVASGGCTALTLAYRVPGLRVTAFDFSELQLAHVRRKADAVTRGDLRALNVGDDSSRGINQCGEFESLFRTLRRFLAEFVAPAEEVEAYFDVETPVEGRRALVNGWCASRYWPAAFSLCFHDALLHAMFGPAATQHAEPGSYPRYFQRAFERGLLRDDGPTNPFLSHVLLGRYLAGHAPDYVRAGRPLAVELVHGQLPDVPDLARFDVVSLSNVFDWSDDGLVATWATTLRALRPGSAVVIRQLNNRRDVRRLLADGFAFDGALGDDLLSRDRSLFYERIEVAFRTP
jgi:S-adenosylmethionine-diacylglycerol 3-amino-3-carboxypropyl transferase